MNETNHANIERATPIDETTEGDVEIKRTDKKHARFSRKQRSGIVSTFRKAFGGRDGINGRFRRFVHGPRHNNTGPLLFLSIPTAICDRCHRDALLQGP